ncbi:MAG: SiaC family regulatory phosphoprotein [Cyclobacteriaceae bacterium]
MYTRFTIPILSDFVSPYSKDVVIEPTVDTPFIMYSEEMGILKIKGNSTNLECNKFYYPLISEILDKVSPTSKLDLEICFSEINTSTVKVLFDLFKALQRKQMSGSTISVNWGVAVGDDDLLDTGADFSELFDLKFSYTIHA